MLQVLPNSHIESRAPIIDAPAPVRLWHLASLDAPTVALTWSLAFAWTVHVRLPLWLPILLALTVWSIYIADRLLDARAALRDSQIHRLRDRHFFHHRHRRVLLPLAVTAAAISACIVFTLMPSIALKRNSILAAASLVYFTRVHTGRRIFRRLPKLFSKELLVGLLFTAGCALPAWTRALNYATLPAHSLVEPLLIPALVFALLAWLNCHAIDRWESEPIPSGRLSIFSLANCLACGTLFIAVLLFNAHPRSALLLIAATAAAFLLALLDRLRTRLTPISLRAAADLVLLTPALLFVLR